MNTSLYSSRYIQHVRWWYSKKKLWVVRLCTII